MIVYVESNYLLELAFFQEQHSQCQTLLGHAEAGRVQLAIPAFSIGECLERIVRRTTQRKMIQATVGTEIRELERSLPYASLSNQLAALTRSLVAGSEDDRLRYDDGLARMLDCADFIPLDKEVIRRSVQVRDDLGLSPQDSTILASVVVHLESHRPSTALFINKNSKDFDNPDITELLRGLSCELKTDFNAGLAAFEAALRRQDRRPMD